jgi:geranylgeranyl pyrophosphate synthase
MPMSLLPQIPKDLLDEVGKVHIQAPSRNCESAVAQLLENTVLLGGKRLRPLLTYLMADLFNLSRDEISLYANAIEWVHSASLAHDDVIDMATTRRGRPSINCVAGNKKSILAGDYLLGHTIKKLSARGNLDLVLEMSKIIEQLALGEWLQSDAAIDRTYSREIITQIAHNKTASVMSWCCVAPAILVDLPLEIVEKCRELGVHLGLAFQLKDDILDFSGGAYKDQGLDLKNGVVNSVLFELFMEHPSLYQQFQAGADSSDIIQMIEKLSLTNAISSVQKVVDEHIRDAFEAVSVISSSLSPYKSLQSNTEKIISVINLIKNRKY